MKRIKDIYNEWSQWTAKWSTSQLWFMFVLNLWWFGIAVYAAHRFDVARDTAIYWQQQAEHSIK